MALVPRVVLVTRPSEYALLLARHGTLGQIRFVMGSRGRDVEPLVHRHQLLEDARARVLGTIPSSWRRAEVSRGDLDRFLFSPGDVVVIVGQDGLVANVAKYLTHQLVVGVNPNPAREAGVLVPHSPEVGAELMVAAGRGEVSEVEERTMACARLDDGQELVALNELFIGQSNHQSARYRLNYDGSEERQSSSGLIVSTGTGSTGWASSIHRCHKSELSLPTPTSDALVFFVREAWPSRATGTAIVDGIIQGDCTLAVTSEMNDTGVIFGDGIEADSLAFGWGQTAQITHADRTLQLVRS